MGDSLQILKEILEADLCVGCGLCEGVSNGAMKMTFNKAGFLRPNAVVENERIADVIVNACPGYKLERPQTPAPSHLIWGHLIKSRVGYASDKDLRYLGSSGGGLSALVSSLISSGFADNVIHVSADEKNPIYNKLKINNNTSAIEKAAGSRYSPSAPLAGLPVLLEKDKRSILVGKPCDIAGARQYLDNNPEYKESLVLMVSFMCGGMPSIHGTKEILQKLDIEENDLVSFRYRGEGWPGQVKAVTKDGLTAKMGYDESWTDILRNHIQFRCKICPDAVGHFADIVFADAWDINEGGIPSFIEADGKSMILSRTHLGEEICKNVIKSGHIHAEEISSDLIIKMQPFHARRVRLNFSRMLALKIAGRKLPVYKFLSIKELAFQLGIWGNIKSLVATLYRIYKKIF